MSQLDPSMIEATAGEIKHREKRKFTWNPFALGYGLLMFLFMNLMDFHEHPQRSFTEPRELVWLPISFVMWVGGSYLVSEWRRRRIARQEEEDL